MASRQTFLYSSLFFASLFTPFTNAGKCKPDPNGAISSLNSSLSGAVQLLEPFALPCFSEWNGETRERDEELCAERQANYTSPSYRSQFAGAYMYEQSAICASDETSKAQCLLDEDDPTNSIAFDGVNCEQGNLPSYYIDIEEPNQVVEAFNYARNSGGQLVIKNSGHSYIEDSTQKGALTLWTANLKGLSHDEAFVPEGCSSQDTYDAITAGAGVNCGEAYKYADSEDVTILCGYSTSVGLSGGWVQGGGHSVLSPVYGLGADRVVQFTVVTPDGSVRKANACQNQDLFWALRGGGGGTYGVVIDATHKVEPVVSMAVAALFVPKGNTTLLYEFMSILVDTAIELAEDGWGGHLYGYSFVHVSPKLKTVKAAKKSMKKVIDFVEANGGSASITTEPTWYSFFEKYVLSSAVVVGNLNIINTRLIPTKVFEDKQMKKNYKKFMKHYIIKEGWTPYVPVDSPYLFKTEPGSTSANPAWYTSIWEMGMPSYWAWNSTYDERMEIAETMQQQTADMEAVTPGGGAYKNEANPFTLDWQQAFFGDLYDDLLEIKQKYDPKTLLKCWKCVGYTEEDASKSCYNKFWALDA